MSDSTHFIRNGVGDAGTATVNIPQRIHQIASTVPAGGNVQSILISNAGLLHVAVAVESTQTGALSVQRYFDGGGLIVVDAAISANLSANVPAIAEINDNKACSCFRITITNTGGSPATLTDLIIMLLTA